MSKLKKQACADPDKFEREHPIEASAAYQAAEAHYRAMCDWRRTDLRNICRENWPEFDERHASPPAPALDARTVDALFDKLSKEVLEYGYKLLNEAEHAAEVGTGDVQFAATAGAAVTSDILLIIAKHRARTSAKDSSR